MKLVSRIISTLLVAILTIVALLALAIGNGMAEISEELCGDTTNTLCIPTK
jgi:hypothetical protein